MFALSRYVILLLSDNFLFTNSLLCRTFRQKYIALLYRHGGYAKFSRVDYICPKGGFTQLTNNEKQLYERSVFLRDIVKALIFDIYIF